MCSKVHNNNRMIPLFYHVLLFNANLNNKIIFMKLLLIFILKIIINFFKGIILKFYELTKILNK